MFFHYQSITIYYEKYGSSKQSIIILPGWGDTRNTFNFLIQHLKTKYTIYIVDYPGFGRSPIPNTTLSINDYGELFYNFLDSLSVSKPIIIAHSFGGRITSLLLGKYHYPIKKVILFDVAGIKRRKSFKVFFKEKIYKLLKKISSIFSLEKQTKWKDFLLLCFASSDYQSLPDSMRKTFKNIISEDLRKYYKQINCDTLIIWGKNDQDTILKDAYYLRKHIINSELIIYHHATHYSYLCYPILTVKIIEEFLKENQV